MEKSFEEKHLQKLIDPKDLQNKIEEIKKSGKTIATLNGSFDLLHAGHLHILYEASKKGDVFIVALNSDSSIKQYKGEKRPIIPLKYRLQMMSAIEFVDFVTYFDEQDPIKILDIIKPTIHVNGIEYGENCIEREIVEKNGGKIHLAKRVFSLSTSNIIEKIKSCDF